MKALLGKKNLAAMTGYLVAAVALLVLAAPAQAHCCNVFSAALGCCNIFGCNCDGPCSNYGCSCPPVAQIGDVCGTCPNIQTCTNSQGVCTGYCTTGVCCNNGASCCSSTTGAVLSASVLQKPTLPPKSEAGPPAPTAAERFKDIDSNKDGHISWAEAEAWLNKNGKVATAGIDALKEGFKKLDTNGNGTIEIDELDAPAKKK